MRKINRKMQLDFIVTKKKSESRTVLKEGFSCYSLPVKGFLGKNYFEKMIVFPLFLAASILLFLFIYLRRKPRAIVGTGGYASFVPLFVGVLFNTPTLISEQDSYPGLTTRMLSRYVSEVHLAHRKAGLFLKAKRVFVTGNPLRDSIREGTKEEALAHYDLDTKKMTVFIIGGSHGAHSINKVFVDVFLHHPFPVTQFIFQTGETDYKWVKDALKDTRATVRILPFIERMNLAYAAADLMFSRAGALTIAELTARGIASVLIPFPFAAGGHQEENARYLETIGASVLLLDRELSEERIVQIMHSLLGDEKRLRMMRTKARSLCNPDAAKKIAERVIALSGGKRDVS